MKPHEAETEKIKEVLFRMMRDIKQDFENRIPTSPITIIDSMKEMLATIPRDKRRIAKQDIVNYVSRQMEKTVQRLRPRNIGTGSRNFRTALGNDKLKLIIPLFRLIKKHPNVLSVEKSGFTPPKHIDFNGFFW